MNTQRKSMAILAAVLVLGVAGSALAAGELVWWKFDKPSKTTAYDSSGNNNAGTLRNMAGNEWTTGKLGKCLKFDGKNDYVLRSALSSSITGDCTVSVWMNRSGVPSTNVRLTDLATAGGSGMQLVVRPTGYASVDNSGGLTDEIAGTQNLCDGSWHHVAVVRTGKTFRLYVDGALAVSNSNGANTAPAFTRLAVAANIGGGNYYQGKLDDVRVYSSALSGTEIQGLYNSGQAAPVNIGGRLELFVDDYLIERMTGVAFRLHAPVKQAPAKGPLPSGPYGTIIKDGDKYRAYYRSDIPGYEIGRQTRNADNEPNEITCYAESRDGIEWTFPDLGITKIKSSKGGNVILARQPPFTHNFSPFLDTRPGVGPDARYKALAGSGGSGLVAFKSADGIHWSKIQDAPVIKTPNQVSGIPWPFDSSSPAFWSEAENCYVAFVRTWGKIEPPQTDPHKKFQRRVSRTTSNDFINWSPLVDTGANLPGEQLYTNQTHPYFRAPHIYIAPMMRFTQGMERGEPVEGNNGSSDIVLMTMRAGSAAYQRTFREAFIRPGLDPQRWDRKANSAWLNVVPTGDAEMSIYHVNGDRYTLRTDGFISVRAGFARGELVTKPLIFDGNALSVNLSTSAAGSLRVELQDASGQPLPGFGLDDCPAVTGDSIERRVNWKNNPKLGIAAGKPVRLRLEMRECDLYSFRFRR